MILCFIMDTFFSSQGLLQGFEARAGMVHEILASVFQRNPSGGNPEILVTLENILKFAFKTGLLGELYYPQSQSFSLFTSFTFFCLDSKNKSLEVFKLKRSISLHTSDLVPTQLLGIVCRESVFDSVPDS